MRNLAKEKEILDQASNLGLDPDPLPHDSHQHWMLDVAIESLNDLKDLDWVLVLLLDTESRPGSSIHTNL